MSNKLIDKIISQPSGSEYYNLSRIMQNKANYYVIFGERSNGKSYAVHEYIIKQFFEAGEQGAIVRRWDLDITGARAKNTFSAEVANGLVKKYSCGKWDKLVYAEKSWYPARYDSKIAKDVLAPEPLCYAFSITSAEHNKSLSYPKVKTILFDEFIATGPYCANEFMLWMSTVSTIVRDRDDVLIFMAGNSVDPYCLYFSEMGLTNISQMRPGDIDLYEFGDGGMSVAVEYCDTSKHKKKKSDVYFCFDNPQLQMITTGAWAFNIYPHLPRKFKDSNIVGKFFILPNSDEILEGDIVVDYDTQEKFIYIHEKTTPIKDKLQEPVFCKTYDPRPNYYKNITNNAPTMVQKIKNFFDNDLVFYQSNRVGSSVDNFIHT